MLIDEVIRDLETLENRFRNDSNLSNAERKDPVVIRAFFSDIRGLFTEEHSPLKGNQGFAFRTTFLDSEINRLILIVRRLRHFTELPLMDLQNTKTLAYAEIDAESFFHFTYSILTLIARLNQHFYQPMPKNFPYRSFKAQKNFFIDKKKNPNDIDPEYRKYLENQTSWFKDFRKYRTQITHYYPLIIAPTSSGLELTIMRGKYHAYFLAIPDYVNSTVSKLLEFVMFYNKHFRKKLNPKPKIS